MTELPAGVTLTVGNQQWPDAEDIVTSTETPGGLRECRFSLSSKGKDIRWDDRLVIYDSTHQAWPFVGRISDIHKTGLCFDFTATRSTRLRTIESTTGPGNPSHPSGVYAGKIYKAGTPMVEALRDALQLCEAVFDGGINVLSGLQFIADSSNVAGYTAEQLWDYVSGLIGGFTTPLLWHVRGLNNEQVVVIDFADLAARYRVHLPEDQIEETYDSEQVITRAAVEWGNDQVYVDSITPSSAGRQLIHNKYVNGSRDLVNVSTAQGLVGYYLSRFGQFMATNSTLTMKCDKDIVQAKPPVGDSDDWPLWLVESGHGLALDGRPISLYPYNEQLKYVIGTEYTWKTGVLTARCGVAGGGLDSRVQGTVDYNVNRLFFGPYNGPPGASAPLADADLLPQVGPEVSGTTTSYAIPAFREAASENDPNVPHKKQIDPDLVADEGLEANINFDPSTTGYQAAIRVIPGTFNEYQLLIGGTTGLVADTIVAEVYKVDSTATGQFLFKIESGGLRNRTIAFSPPAVLGRKDMVMVKVTTAGATATWAAVSLHAKKNFPALKS